MSTSEASALHSSSAGLRYALSVSSVVAAVIVTYLLPQDFFISLLFYLAIMLSAWFGGLGPGLIASLLATLAINYFFLNRAPATLIDLTDLPKIVVFFGSALLISSRSVGKSRPDELDLKIQERAADL